MELEACTMAPVQENAMSFALAVVSTYACVYI